MNKSNTFFITVLLCPSLMASEPVEQKYNASISIGEEYNSNLTIDELDLGSNQSGLLTNIELEVDAQLSPSKDHQINLAYMFSRSIHEEYSEFDLESHGFSLGYDFTEGDYTYGLDYMFFDATLDSADFLQMNFITPSVSYMLNDTSLLRFAYNFTDKSFDTFTDRDADSNGVDISYYSFFNQAKSYFRWQLSTAQEDAVTDEFDFDSYTVGFSVNSTVPSLAEGAKVNFDIKYSERDYSQRTEEIMAFRAEEWSQVRLNLIVPIYENMTLDFGVEHNDRASNLASADYTETRAMVDFIYEF
ncbi:MAG: DUF560 domain-containing protein [Enterobacterales bacterium]|nr:DUF560 domain-containing protein [Enterobacterales bacterium]